MRTRTSHPHRPRRLRALAAIFFSAVLLADAGPAHAQLVTPTTFTYQGRLLQDGQPYTGTADVRFTLVRPPSAGGALPPIVRLVDVDNGTFSASLDFGADLTGAAVQFDGSVSSPTVSLEIAVRIPAGSGNPFVPLVPAQTLSPAPAALGLPGFSRASTSAANVSQLLEDTTFQINANVVQTVVPTRNGDVESVLIKFTNTGAAAPVTLTLRLNSTLIGTSTATVPPGGGLVRFAFPVGTLVGTSAALRLDFNTTTAVGVRYASNNPYAAGTANFLDSADIVFSLNLRDGGVWLSAVPIQIQSSASTVLAAASGNPAGAAIVLSATGSGGGSFTLQSTAASSPAGAGRFRLAPVLGADSAGLTLDSTGRVGVNKLTPGTELHVGGSLTVDGGISIASATRQYNVAAVACSTLGSLGGVAVGGNSVSGSTAGVSIVLTAPVDLPNGAVISKLRASLQDNATENVTLSLLSMNISTGATTTLRTLSTSGALASFVVFSLDVLPVPAPVDNAANVYFIRANWTTPSSPANVAIRSLGVEYTVTSPLP